MTYLTISHDLLPKQKARSIRTNRKIVFFRYATELYHELDALGMMERMKKVPQLGVIRVGSHFNKSRYDYAMLQLYLHQVAKKHLNPELKLSYGNDVNPRTVFPHGFELEPAKRPSVAELIQILVLIHNVGHFCGTFTSSRAVILHAKHDKVFYERFIQSFGDERYVEIAKRCVADWNESLLHHLNAKLILDRCDQSKNAVRLAQVLLYAYVSDDGAGDEEKRQFIFWLFRTVRDVAYVAYDLQIASTAISLDALNLNEITLLLRELLSQNNNRESTQALVDALKKLLDDTLYFKTEDVICYHRIASSMRSSLPVGSFNYFDDLFLEEASPLNESHSHLRGYFEDTLLKLTFSYKDRSLAHAFHDELERTHHVRSGFYHRYSGETTVVVALKRSCKNQSMVAFRVFQMALRYLRQIEDIESCDSRFLLATKFFLEYLCTGLSVYIKPTIHKEDCVFVTRGSRKRIDMIRDCLNMSSASEDMKHEAEHLIKCMEEDPYGGVTVMIPASIVWSDKENKSLCELDGMLLYPNWDDHQLVLLEAKNKKASGAEAKRCLKKSLKTLGIPYADAHIATRDADAWLRLAVSEGGFCSKG